jgi:peptidoglycan/LPS O-acetylase OafA/YrhL
MSPWWRLAMAFIVYLFVSIGLDSHPELATSSVLRSAGFGLVGFLLITGAIAAEHRYGWINSAFGALSVRIGDASYTLYLSHWFVLSGLGKLLLFMPNLPLPLLVAWQGACIIAAVALALAIAEHWELPLHRRLLRLFKQASEHRAMAASRGASA